MIVLPMFLLMQEMAAPTPRDEIVVTGQRAERLKRLRMTTRVDRKTGNTRCIYKRRSGDPELDKAVCDAVLACVPNVKTVEEMEACIAPTMDSLVADGVPWQTQATTPNR